jgi:CBS domain-containing protein
MAGRSLLAEPRLDRALRDLMTPGVVALPDSASLRSVFLAMRAHRVHAVLVVGHADAAPLGWVTSRALLEHASTELALYSARDAVDEAAVMLPPGATAAEAIAQMRASGAGRVGVRDPTARLPEGVVTDLDLIGLLVERG